MFWHNEPCIKQARLVPKKAERELKEGKAHRGLIKGKPSKAKAEEHIAKADHYLKATEYLKKGGFSDISASTAFYSMHHCFLAIAARHGYESRNQECTFALISTLIEDAKISLDKETISKIASIDVSESQERTSTKIREEYQYGTALSMEEKTYRELLTLSSELLEQAKEIIEK